MQQIHISFNLLFAFNFQTLDRGDEHDYDYRVVYCNQYRSGFRMARAEYCIYEAEIIMKLNPPAEKKVLCDGKYVRLMVFEEVYVMDDGSVQLVK